MVIESTRSVVKRNELKRKARNIGTRPTPREYLAVVASKPYFCLKNVRPALLGMTNVKSVWAAVPNADQAAQVLEA